MQYLVTSSGYTLVPPSGLTIVLKSFQLDSIASSGNIIVSGSLATYNIPLLSLTPVVLDIPFKQGENITISPTSGTAVVNYIYGGEPDAYKYAKQAHAYSAQETSGTYYNNPSGVFKKWNDPISGTYQPISGGFGG